MKHHRKGPWVWTIFILSLLSAFVLVHNPAKVHQALIPDRASARLGSRDLRQPGRPQIVGTYGKLPLSFEANQGQTDRQVKFLSRGSGYALFLTSNEAVLSLRKGKANSKGQVAKIERRGNNGADQFSKSAAFPAFFRPAVAVVTDNSALTATDNEPPTTSAVVHMELLGTNTAAKVVGLDELPGKSNYFIGNDPKKWHTNVPNYAKVRYHDVYPGVDLIYYGNQGQLEYDFVVAPGADPRQIALRVETGKSSIVSRRSTTDVAADGDLVIQADGGEVGFHKPIVYQSRLTGNRQSTIVNRQFLEGHYILTASNEVRFALGPYDHSKPLIIDPALKYSTYLGGSGNDEAYGIAVDGAGNAYVAGYTSSADFPTQNPFQGGYPGVADGFVTKLSPAGSALVYSTYLGGSYGAEALGIAVDGAGNAYVTGVTNSFDFPTQNPFQGTNAGGDDAFVTKLSPTGSALVYSTYLGGSAYDNAFGIAVDSAGNAYVTGFTASTNFPTKNPFQGSNAGYQNAFVTKLSPTGSALVYSTYLGGSAYDNAFGIAVDSAGNAYVTGETSSTNFPTQNPFQGTNAGGDDAFVTKLSPTGSALVYSTYLGGSGGDGAYGIAVDGAGNAYVTGPTWSRDFPIQNPFQGAYGGGYEDAFVTKLSPTGSALVYSTYLGGSGGDGGRGIALDSARNAYVTGYTNSTNFPTQNPFQGTNAGGDDAFVTQLSPTGSALVYSTYLGGSGGDAAFGIALDSARNAYVTGLTYSTDFPTQNPFQGANAGGDDAFVAQISVAVDNIPPTTVATASPGPNSNGWNNTNVTVTLNATDNPGGSGVKQIQFALNGAQNLGWQTVAGNAASVTISAEGTTILSYFATDNAGNQETAKTLTVRIDKTPPVISGLPAPGCTIWPPNHKLVQVATVTAMDALSGLAPGSFTVTGTSNDPANGQIVISGGPSQFKVQLGADKGQIYTLTATAIDLAGNTITQQATCTVPQNQGN